MSELVGCNLSCQASAALYVPSVGYTCCSVSPRLGRSNAIRAVDWSAAADRLDSRPANSRFPHSPSTLFSSSSLCYHWSASSAIWKGQMQVARRDGEAKRRSPRKVSRELAIALLVFSLELRRVDKCFESSASHSTRALFPITKRLTIILAERWKLLLLMIKINPIKAN